MNRILTLLASLLILGSPSLTAAGPKEDVAEATQAWIAAMNSHDPERVVALYDAEAVLWGTRSPTLRDNPATVREYFNVLRPCRQSTRVPLLSNEFASMATLPSIAGPTPFWARLVTLTASSSVVRRRFSFVYRKRDGRWLIVDHHSSAVPAAPSVAVGSQFIAPAPRCSSRPGRWCGSWRSARLPGSHPPRSHAADRARGYSHCRPGSCAARR